MSRYHSYISSATAILETYKGEEPFVLFLKKKFAANKKFGSRDRKIISSLCYSYFRAMHLFKDETTEQKIIKGFFLCESKSNILLEGLYPDLNNKIEWETTEKLNFLQVGLAELFPFLSELSEEINTDEFAYSFLRQPLLYLRIRPGKKNAVIAKLNEAAILFSLVNDDCIALQNSTSLDKILRINKEVVVQDYNSQKVFNFLIDSRLTISKNKKISVWDCCAASGGKSILLFDKLSGNIQLTVSDIRKNILHNLQERLQQASVPVYKTFAADLTLGIPQDKADNFDIIICDVPCTGSGTWSRTPEQPAFFNEVSINEFAAKQKKIASNATMLLKKGGLFFYITCSVFKKENEAIIEILQNEFELKLLLQEYLKGYTMQADSLFVAVLQK